jgi:hypothetical protein
LKKEQESATSVRLSYSKDDGTVSRSRVQSNDRLQPGSSLSFNRQKLVETKNIRDAALFTLSWK